MTAPKPGLKDKFWAHLHKNDSFGENCFELRLAAASGNLWRTAHLIDKLRDNAHPTTELEIGYAMQKAAINGQNAVIDLMFEKDCGLALYQQPQQEQRRFCNIAQEKAYKNSAAHRQNQKQLAALGKLNWQEISFLYAVTANQTATAKLFIEKGIKADLDHNRALLLAVNKDFRDITALLLENGADSAVNDYEAIRVGIYHDSSRMFGDSCLDPLLAQTITIPKDQMQALITATLKEDNFHSPTLKKVLNFALRQPDKADVTPLFDLPVLQWNDIAYNMLKEYQELCVKASRQPAARKTPKQGL